MFGLGKRNAEIDEFAVRVAGSLARRFPPALEADVGTKHATEKHFKALNDVQAQMSAFRREKKLGVYGKARLLNTLKWELKRLGYSEAFIDSTLRGLLRIDLDK